jgi:hypothetical protein
MGRKVKRRAPQTGGVALEHAGDYGRRPLRIRSKAGSNALRTSRATGRKACRAVRRMKRNCRVSFVSRTSLRVPHRRRRPARVARLYARFPVAFPRSQPGMCLALRRVATELFTAGSRECWGASSVVHPGTSPILAVSPVFFGPPSAGLFCPPSAGHAFDACRTRPAGLTPARTTRLRDTGARGAALSRADRCRTRCASTRHPFRTASRRCGGPTAR